MQSRLRLHLATAITLFALLFLSPPVRAQADRLLPSSWNDAVNQLANRVAAVVDPATPVSIEMENISAIEGSDQNYIESDFENALRQHSLIIYPPSSSAIRLAVRLHLTLSESADAYIWAVQIFNNPHDPNSFSSAIVSVPRLTGYGSTSGGLPVVSLERRLVWKQPSRFLDFDIVKDSAVGDAALLILQTDRLTVYKLSGPDWVLFREIPISSAPSRSRAPEGSIEAQKNSIYVPGLACTIDRHRAIKRGDAVCIADLCRRKSGGCPQANQWRIGDRIHRIFQRKNGSIVDAAQHHAIFQGICSHRHRRRSRRYRSGARGCPNGSPHAAADA